MKPLRLFNNFFSLYAYSCWKVCHPVRLLERSEYYLKKNFRNKKVPFSFRYGSERSSVFVSLACLVQQLKTEAQSDVFTTVRKLRSQRQGMVQHVVSFTCYQFSNEPSLSRPFFKCFRASTSLFIELYRIMSICIETKMTNMPIRCRSTRSTPEPPPRRPPRATAASPGR